MAITQFTRFKSDKPEEMVKAAKQAKTIFEYASDGKLLLEAKDDMKKRGMPSPDEGDAVALCFSEPNGSPIPRNVGFNRKIEYPDQAYA